MNEGLREVPVMENAAASSGKKRKLGLRESIPAPLFQLKARRLAVMTPVNSDSSVDCEYSTSCECVISLDNVVISAVCSSHGSGELEKIQKENIDEGTGDSLDCRVRERETSPLIIEVQAESGELESTARPLESNFRRPFTTEKMPSEDELEEFFAAAEKNLQKKFIDKYNFDIAMDKPLEGSYEWVQIQPKPS
ncbi:cyclin-dependent kinase inhibitor 1-like isoform X2 [Primulina huaijiensis]|uniref:cyclin-dependent kinase inhibitor 1-like isoform X2 n=1 Tax=Primulina huaijiensis TaxID=1492673 RepID=UPI003CC73D85